MSKSHPDADQDFLQRQRRRLTDLREQLQSVQRRLATEQSDIIADSNGRPGDMEDDALKVDTLDRSANLAAMDEGRLANIGRALQKIDEGTYGISDESGEPIPRARLEASPEALCTVEEQAEIDARSQRVMGTNIGLGATR